MTETLKELSFPGTWEIIFCGHHLQHRHCLLVCLSWASSVYMVIAVVIDLQFGMERKFHVLGNSSC